MFEHLGRESKIELSIGFKYFMEELQSQEKDAENELEMDLEKT